MWYDLKGNPRGPPTTLPPTALPLTLHDPSNSHSVRSWAPAFWRGHEGASVVMELHTFVYFYRGEIRGPLWLGSWLSSPRCSAGSKFQSPN